VEKNDIVIRYNKRLIKVKEVYAGVTAIFEDETEARFEEDRKGRAEKNILMMASSRQPYRRLGSKELGISSIFPYRVCNERW
jgi:hypothetical protein